MVRILGYLLGVMIRLFKISMIVLVWPFLDHTPGPGQHSVEAERELELDQLSRVEMLEALEVQQGALREQIKFWEYEANRSNTSANKRVQLQTKISNGNVKLLKMNERIMKLRKELEDVQMS